MRRIEEIVGGPFERGCRPGIPFDRYKSLRGLNPSVLADARKSMLNAKWSYENATAPDDSTDEQMFGNFVETVVLEPARIDEWAVWDGDRRGNKWLAFQLENEGRRLIKRDGKHGYDSAMRLVDSMTKDPRVQEIARSGQSQVSVFSVESDMQVKGRIDWISVSARAVVDFKTTTNADPRAFWSNAYSRFAYHMKLALYTDWFQRESGKAVDQTLLVIAETAPPYHIVVERLPEAELDRGIREAKALMARVRACIEANHWPGIGDDEIISPYVPTYVMPGDQELEGYEIN